MTVTDSKAVKGFINMANDGWNQGWHERNGGNLSYRMKQEEVKTEDNTVHYFIPLTCHKCSLYINNKKE